MNTTKNQKNQLLLIRDIKTEGIINFIGVFAIVTETIYSLNTKTNEKKLIYSCKVFLKIA